MMLPLDPFQLASLNQFFPKQVVLDPFDPVSAAAESFQTFEDFSNILNSLCVGISVGLMNTDVFTPFSQSNCL